MCIIVAKNSGIKMPSEETLRNCFKANPDGAGFMIAAKNKVYGFKGLMTFEEFTAELAKAEKRFGKLIKLPVVMHFRISTHGSVVAGNTHPFPLKGGYRNMRKTEWVADQGFAHNGIIFHTSRDYDIKKHNVSDTMVFAKKFINPIAKHVSIAADKEIQDMLYDLADSKLCFLDKNGRLSVRGSFVNNDGVLYSNESFKDKPKAKIKSFIPYSYAYDLDDYCDRDAFTRTEFKLSPADEYVYMVELAEELGYYPLGEGTHIVYEDGGVELVTDGTDQIYIDDDGALFRFESAYLDFVLYATPDEYTDIVFFEEEDYE